MNTQSNTMPEAFESQRVAPAVLSATRPLYWSIRRELWEHRSIYIAPLAAAGVFLFGFMISLIRFPHRMKAAMEMMPDRQQSSIMMPYDMVSAMLMLTAMLVGAFYCLDAFQGERRDRSILFWKSLPVSDVTVVLAKASIPLMILPLLAWAIAVVTQWIMLLMHSAVLLGSGQSVVKFWSQLAFFQMSAMLLYHLVTIHALWHAPFYAWLMAVSSWARRAAFLWASLPVIGIIVIERIVFRTSYFAQYLGYRLTGSGAEALTTPGTFPTDPMTHLTPFRFLVSPGLWGGLAFTAVCLAIAVRLRRYRGPI